MRAKTLARIHIMGVSICCGFCYQMLYNIDITRNVLKQLDSSENTTRQTSKQPTANQIQACFQCNCGEY